MMVDIMVEELKTRLDNGEKLHILDVREGYEFDEFNINGKLIPLGSLQSSLDELSAWKEEEVIVHCKAGGRSAMAKEIMLKNGFTNVRNLLGGMLDWQKKYGQ